ncbi:MAG: quinolinate synthase NadA [Odoribacteraceae bacterium]|jgi:quinolinate synthase|nr:quinolinate synthase NadA [Odoribacteraceae bacterium]
MSVNEISNRIKQLQAEKNAIILAHYYTRPEVQEVADYLGDSLGLSRMAGRADARVIVFCGVHFMAETASIISPDKKVLIPALHAGCSLAESITGADLLAWRAAHPDGLVVCYVNTSADVKAHSDYCCTSSNAVKVVQSLPAGRPVLFVPDKNLGAYINKVTGREMELWHGDCCVHERLPASLLLERLDEYPEAVALVHPEVNGSHDDRVLQHPRAFIASTAGMIEHARTSPCRQFIVATELETIHQLKKNSPDKEFIPALRTTLCGQMKKITLERVLDALEHEQFEVSVPDDTRRAARIPIQRMLEIQ